MTIARHTSSIRFHHVGVITENLIDSITLYEDLGYSSSNIYADGLQKAHIALMQQPHHPIIELITPDGPDSPVASWVQRIKAGPYHICYEVKELVQGIEFLHSRRLFPVSSPIRAVAFNMRRVAFLWSNRSGLIELLEASNP